MTRSPVLIDMEGAGPADPARAPALPEESLPGEPLLEQMAHIVRPPSRLARIFWVLALGLTGTVVSVAAWDFAMGLVTRMPLVGYGVAIMGLGLLGVAALIALREALGLMRLGRLDRLHRDAAAALVGENITAARDLVRRLEAHYTARDELRWGMARLRERAPEQFDAEAILGLVEAELLVPLDRMAEREVEIAARLVATVTAVVPLALADVVTALLANLRMIRRIAEIYGGRAGLLGSWRLARAVMAHLVGTGAVAVGDDLISSVAGGGVLSKISRRFGEGVVNGALTARVGVAAIELCRPLPYIRKGKPSVTALVRRALAGLFGQARALAGRE